MSGLAASARGASIDGPTIEETRFCRDRNWDIHSLLSGWKSLFM